MARNMISDGEQPDSFNGLRKLRALEEANAQARAELVSHAPTAYDDAQNSPLGDQFHRRILKEISFMSKTPDLDGWFTISPVVENNLRHFLGTIRGPPDSPWEGGIFHVCMSLDDTYPHLPPRAWFLTKILHPNVDAHGTICMDLLSRFMWAPALTLEKILVCIILLLNEPNFEFPVEDQLPEDWTSDEEEFKRRAREWSKKYASGHIVYPGGTQAGYATVCDRPPPA
jgi:ubiquitin-protein ligase